VPLITYGYNAVQTVTAWEHCVLESDAGILPYCRVQTDRLIQHMLEMLEHLLGVEGHFCKACLKDFLTELVMEVGAANKVEKDISQEYSICIMTRRKNIQQLIPNVDCNLRFLSQLLGQHVFPPLLSAWRVTVKHGLIDVSVIKVAYWLARVPELLVACEKRPLRGLRSFTCPCLPIVKGLQECSHQWSLWALGIRQV
jgi:hypothetical protein